MRRSLAAAVLFAVALFPVRGEAQVFLGLRAGYALPGGDVVKSQPLDATTHALIPFTLDLGMKLGKRLAIGAYASYGVIQPARAWRDACEARGSRCSAADLSIGAQLNVHSERSGPWGGVAIGYEELRTKDSLDPIGARTWKGYEATLQGGLDVVTASGLRVGPFVSLTAGHFRWLDSPSETDLSDTELHGWLRFGLRILVGI